MKTKPDQPDVSVIIPAYRVEKWLARAVHSALDQQGITLEVVVVDDKSPDGTLAVARQLAATDPRVVVVASPENRGAAATRNAALTVARGEFLAVLDADDAYRPGRLQRMISVARELDADVIADILVFYDLKAGAEAPIQPHALGPPRRLGIADFLRPEAEVGFDLGILKPMFRRRLLDTGLLRYRDDLRHGEDFDLTISLLRAGHSFYLLHEPFYVFSTRIGAISGTFSPGSTTPINYRSIADHSLALAADMEAKGDADDEVIALLRERAERTARQNRIYCWTALRHGEWRRLRNWLQADPRNRGDLLKVLGQKLVARRGLPH